MASREAGMMTVLGVSVGAEDGLVAFLVGVDVG